MDASDLHVLARRLREAALVATGNTGEDRVSAGLLAVMEDLADHDDSTVGAVAGRTGLAQSLVSRICAQLTDAGVLTRRTDPEDRRRSLLTVAPDARGLLESRGRRTIDHALVETFPRLTVRERERLQRHLQAASELMARGLPEFDG